MTTRSDNNCYNFSHQALLWLVLIIVLLLTGESVKALEKNFVLDESTSLLRLGRGVILGSDSLWLNHRLLVRGDEYDLRAITGQIQLHLKVSANDTLLIRYTPLPIWLTKSFGRQVPAIGQLDRPAPTGQFSSPAKTHLEKSEILISGSKSFKITSRSVGSSDFSQTLDMKIMGELSDGLFISGNVTDRDVDPTYGTMNSRLSELDRMNIRVYSSSFETELGDLSLGTQYGLSRSQRMTGLGFRVAQPNWTINGIVARPRGEFKSVKLVGQDGLQGPYQLNQSGGSSPVVPGSETVWLDGQLLKRGTDKDYQLDYTLGRITFNVNYPIDTRSRIEIDFEPQNSLFKKQLYAGGVRAKTNDSGSYFGFQFVREGDDADQPLFGELSDSDAARLAQAGDSILWVNSVISDSSGHYVIIIDSLPDTLYQWVEVGGQYAVSFTYVGHLAGDYNLIGNGVYEYVGHLQGSYLSLKELSAPEQTSHYKLNAGYSNDMTGNLDLVWRTSVYDQNLISSLHDDDNSAMLIDLTNHKRWANNSRLESLDLHHRFRQPEYRTRERIYAADFHRRYYLPLGFIARTDERLTDGKLKLRPFQAIAIETEYSKLLYENVFNADVGRFSLGVDLSKKIGMSIAWQGVRSTLDSAMNKLDGEAISWQSDIAYRFGHNWEIKSSFENDNRENRYKTELQGTRYRQLGFEFGQAHETIRYEHYTEDSLIIDWTKLLTRKRLTIHSNREIDQLNYNLTLTRQWLTSKFENRDDFLGRLNLRHNNQSAGITSSASYLISNEVRNARGIIYFEVAPGEGEFILDESAPGGPQYIPDEQGNYICLEEVLSQISEVKRGERSFLFSKTGHGWRVRFDSRQVEDLLSLGKRSWWWAVPFLVDESQKYLFFTGRHSLDFRAVEQDGFYLVNISGSRQVEKRLIGDSSPARETLALELSFKQRTGLVNTKESVSLFRTDRDNYYSGIGVVNGYRLQFDVKKNIGNGEAGVGAGQRVAKTDSDEKVITYLLKLTSQMQLLTKGRLRGQLEYYVHQFSNINGEASYQLTDNRAGTKGAIWSLSLQYGLQQDLRVNISLSGKHSDNRSGRVLARGELIATF